MDKNWHINYVWCNLIPCKLSDQELQVISSSRLEVINFIQCMQLLQFMQVMQVMQVQQVMPLTEVIEYIKEMQVM